MTLAALVTLSCGIRRDGHTPKPFTAPHAVPILGVDMIYQDAPHVLIRAFKNPKWGDPLADTLENRLGVHAIRLNSFGFYSFLGPERSAELRRLTRQGNVFPWFNFDEVVAYVAAHDLRIVAGLNPEDGPDAARAFVERFERRGILDHIIAVEIGNEPHLSKRPWQPEEYAEQAAAIIEALEPTGVKFAVSLTLGKETKTPTGISDDDYTRRELGRLDALVPLADRQDIYGVIHLYARGVDPDAIERLNALVRPIAPRMRYLVTEYNIRSSLAENQQLTTEYGLEFVQKTGRLVADPDVAGLFAHGVPYHSLVYFVAETGVATVSGYRDARLTGDGLAPGWHLTPAGRLYGLFASSLWHGDVLAFEERGDVQVWTVRQPDGETRLGVLNATSSPVERTVTLGGTQVTVRLAPRSGVVVGPAGEIGRVELPNTP